MILISKICSAQTLRFCDIWPRIRRSHFLYPKIIYLFIYIFINLFIYSFTYLSIVYYHLTYDLLIYPSIFLCIHSTICLISYLLYFNKYSKIYSSLTQKHRHFFQLHLERRRLLTIQKHRVHSEDQISKPKFTVI